MGKINGVNLICSFFIDIVKEVEIELADFSTLTKNVCSLLVGLSDNCFGVRLLNFTSMSNGLCLSKSVVLADRFEASGDLSDDSFGFARLNVSSVLTSPRVGIAGLRRHCSEAGYYEGFHQYSYVFVYTYSNHASKFI